MQVWPGIPERYGQWAGSGGAALTGFRHDLGRTSAPGDGAAPTRLPGLPVAVARRWPTSLTTLPIAGVLSVGLLVVGAPLLAVVNAARQGRPVELPILVFLTVGALTVLALAPVVSIAVAAIERWRLRLVDPRPLHRQRCHGPGRALHRCRGLAGGRPHLLARRPRAAGVLAALPDRLLDLTLIASPWLVGDADPVIVVWTTVDTPGRRSRTRSSGVLLLPVLVYLARPARRRSRPRWPGGCSAGPPTGRRCGRSPARGPGWSTRTRPNAAASSATCTTARSPG